MALSIKSEEADRLARELAAKRGVSLTEAVVTALKEELRRENASKARRSALEEELLAIARRCAALPTLDTRSEDEILGYDENGIPS